MRMDDNLLPAAGENPTGDAPDLALAVKRPERSIRFTSNVVGTLFLLTDILCFVVSAPITLAVYSVVRGSRVLAPVHITAFVLMLGSFLLIRIVAAGLSSQPARPSRQQRYDVRCGDQQPDRHGADLAGRTGRRLFTRRLTLFLLTVVLCLSVSRPILNRLITRLAENGQIEQRIAFYGADPRIGCL